MNLFSNLWSPKNATDFKFVLLNSLRAVIIFKGIVTQS